MSNSIDHSYFMSLALKEAQKAWEMGEVPVGAVIVDNEGRMVATGFNQMITRHDPSAHAEIMALRAAAESQKNYRLPGLHLYVTLEPCMMCLGAICHARLASVVFAASDPKTGVCGSVACLNEMPFNHHTKVIGGVLAAEAGDMLSRFFKERRIARKESIIFG